MATPKERKKKLITEIPQSLWDEATEQAKREDRSTAALVRIAVRQYLDRADDEVR